jgi:hypothetical protein
MVMRSHRSPIRSALRLLVAWGLVGLPSAGCLVDVSLSDSRLVCSDGECPDGFSCVDGRCVRDGEGVAPDAAQAEPDAAPPPPDAPPPADGAPEPDAPLLLTCEEQYGGAPGFALCVEEPDSCEFFLEFDPGTPCAEHCPDIGAGECLTAFNADPADPCARQEETGCDGVNVSQICVCSRLVF